MLRAAFSVNKGVAVENLKDMSFIALIFDRVNRVEDVLKVQITYTLLKSESAARQKYERHHMKKGNEKPLLILLS